MSRGESCAAGARTLAGGVDVLYLIQQIENNPKIQVRTCTEVVDTCGEDGHLSGLWLENRQTGVRERVDCGRMCCFIGASPRTEWLDGIVARDDRGFILTGPDLRDVCGWNLDRPPHHLETSVPGVFVAGMCAPSQRSVSRRPSAKVRWP